MQIFAFSLFQAHLGFFLVGIYMLFNFENNDKTISLPTCSIKELGRQERVRRSKLNGPIRYPEREAENPILYQSFYAVVVFENATDNDLALFGLRLDKKPELYRVTDAFTVEVEVYNSKKEIVKPTPNYAVSLASPTMPSADKLKTQDAPFLVAIRPKEKIEISFSLLGKLQPQDVMPGEYSVKAKVSFAIAPEGEKKVIESAPYKIIIKEEHLKATHEFWKRQSLLKKK